MSTETEVAKHLDLSTRRLRELIAEGVIHRPATRNYDLDKTRTVYIRHLRKIAAGRAAPSGGLDLAAERAKLAKAQSEGHELKNKIARGEYVEIEAVAVEVEAQYSIVRERLLSIPGKISAGLVSRSQGEIFAALEGEIHQALAELSAADIEEAATKKKDDDRAA